MPDRNSYLPWCQVGTDGFGYSNLIGITSMKVFKDQLYVGTRAADNTSAKLFKISKGFDIEEIHLPCGARAERIGPIGVLRTSRMQWIYVAAWMSDIHATAIFRSHDGMTWEETYPSFNNLAFDICQGGDTLYLAMGSEGEPGSPEIWLTEGIGASWRKASQTSSQIADNRENLAITSLCYADDCLYMGTWGNRRNVHGAEIWVRDSQARTRLDYYFRETVVWGVISLCAFQGRVYAGTVDHSGAQIWRRRGNSDWEEVGPPRPSISAGGAPIRYNAMCNFEGALYAGGGFPAFIIRTYDGTSWERVCEDGFGDSDNYVINALEKFPILPPYQPIGVTCLLAGTLKVPEAHTGMELWRHCRWHFPQSLQSLFRLKYRAYLPG